MGCDRCLLPVSRLVALSRQLLGILWKLAVCARDRSLGDIARRGMRAGEFLQENGFPRPRGSENPDIVIAFTDILEG